MEPRAKIPLTSTLSQSLLASSPLSVAASFGQLNEVRRLLSDEESDPNEDSPLLFATTTGKLEVVKVLLRDPRIDVNVMRYDLATPLFVACQESRLEIAKTLLCTPGVDVNHQDSEGWSPFFLVCQKGNLEFVKLLLRHPDVDINLATKENHTPLYAVAQRGHTKTLKWILASGLEVDITTPWERTHFTPLEQAKRNGFKEIADLLMKFQEGPTATRDELRKELGLERSPSSLLLRLPMSLTD